MLNDMWMQITKIKFSNCNFLRNCQNKLLPLFYFIWYIGNCIVSLGLLRQYLVSADQRSIYELNKTSSQYRSWLVGESVQSGMCLCVCVDNYEVFLDGSFYVCTKMDPLYFILAALLSSKVRPK